MEHFYQNIQGWFTWTALYRDMVNVFPSGSSFVEIGVYGGQSLSYLVVEMINAHKEFNITAIDSFHEPQVIKDDIYGQFLINIKPISDKFTFIKGDSAESASLFKDLSVDFLFLDAMHDYESVQRDIFAWLPKIKEGGIIAGHDYSDAYPEVIRAVDDIFGERMNIKYLEELCWLVEL